MIKILSLFILGVSLSFSYVSIFANKNISGLSEIEFKINENMYTGEYVYEILDKKISELSNKDINKKLILYKKLENNIKNYLKNQDTSSEKKLFLTNIEKLLIYGQEYNKNIIKNKIILNNTVQKIKLGESELGESIYGYYKGDPKKGFFGIFANIHGSYEYGTYDTANYLLKELKNTQLTGWFIIPTLNPDGLKEYKKYGKKYSAYIQGRDNLNNIDLNRNFCTKNFQLKTFQKNGLSFQTARKKCNSEKESQVVINTLTKFEFHNIISLHSVGGNFFIPDNSIDDLRIISLGNDMKQILKNYNFDISYSNKGEKIHKIFDYEIDEGGSNQFTGTMETYIYEAFNIPIIIIELEKHGTIEYDLIKIKSLLQNKYKQGD